MKKKPIKSLFVVKTGVKVNFFFNLRFGWSFRIGKIAIGIADIHFFTIVVNPYGKKPVIYPCVCKTRGTGGRIADFDTLF